MRMITMVAFRGRNHDMFQANTIDTRRLSEESVEITEYKQEKANRIKLYQELVKHQMALGDD